MIYGLVRLPADPRAPGLIAFLSACLASLLAVGGVVDFFGRVFDAISRRR